MSVSHDILVAQARVSMSGLSSSPLFGIRTPLKAYSQDLRDRVIAALEAGDATQKQIAQRFSVSPNWVKKIWARWRATGSAAALPHGGGPTPKLTPTHKQRLAELVGEQPDATLAELKERSGAPVSQGWLCQILDKLELRRKKKPARRRARPRGRPRGAPSVANRASGGGRPRLVALPFCGREWLAHRPDPPFRA